MDTFVILLSVRPLLKQLNMCNNFEPVSVHGITRVSLITEPVHRMVQVGSSQVTSDVVVYVRMVPNYGRHLFTGCCDDSPGDSCGFNLPNFGGRVNQYTLLTLAGMARRSSGIYSSNAGYESPTGVSIETF